MNTAVSVLMFVAAFTWLLVAITTSVVALVAWWRRRSMRMWIADFDRGLEREERLRAMMRSRN